MRQNAAWQSIPVIVVTARDLTEADRHRLEAAAQGIIAKGGGTQVELTRAIRDLPSRQALPADPTGPS